MKLQELSIERKRRFIRGLVASACLVTFQAYLVAPLAPALAKELHASVFEMGFSIPSFAIPFGISSFFCSLLVEIVDRQKFLKGLLFSVAASLLLLAMADNAAFFFIIRAIIGFLSGGVVQLSMSMMNDMFHRTEREKPFSWLILAHAAGMTFGPTAGACLYPFIGWRWEFILLSFWALLVLVYGFKSDINFPIYNHELIQWRVVKKKCSLLLFSTGGKRIYSFIYLNGIFHAGLFVWVSYYLGANYKFGNQGTGLMLLLFSLPGLMMAVNIGLATQKYGRAHVILWGLLTVSATIAVLLLNTTFGLDLFAIGLLSVGYVMTQPFYAGIINSIRNRNSRGLAIGLGFGLLFLGYGSGPIIFQFLLGYGMLPALIALAILELILMLLCRDRRATILKSQPRLTPVH